MRGGATLVVVVCACGSDPAKPIDANADAVIKDAPLDGVADAASFAFPITFNANGARWDDASATLFLTDDTNDQLATWTDADSFGVKGTFPPRSQSSRSVRWSSRAAPF